MIRQEIYRSESARVVSVGRPEGKVCCATFFTYATDEASLSTVKGFGEDILARIGIPAVHFINLKNHWWQINDLSECLQAGAEVLGLANRRIGYGASMGGYAALRFSKALSLDESLVFSPKYSIDRDRVPFEKRWASQASQLDFSSESMDVNESSTHHIVFDPRCDDAAHVDLVVADNPGADIRLHPVHEGDHFVIGDFQARGILSNLLKAFQIGVSMRTF